MKITVVKKAALFEFLQEQYPDSPRTRVKKLLQSGTVLVNNIPVSLHSYKLNTGDIVEIVKSGIKTSKASSPFPVLYEDKEVIVIDKPAGISTSSVDGSRNVRDELSSFLRDNTKGTERAWVVHRLDKEVSGVLLYAKSLELAETIKERWEETEKQYYALVEGLPVEPEGTIKSYLKEDRQQKVFSSKDQEKGKLAITDYKVLRQVKEFTLLNIKTHTGRKNQIRVHMADLGCPIVGDRKYGASAKYIRRVRLHAYSLSFPHPVSGNIISVNSRMPEKFLVVKEGDEKYK
ncbi:MAG TPA: RluA family pseudouridine synthase [Bacteroidales bacterium]|nr:RluA family pseudouridine synthase [Bacteroidales bacterium]